MKTKSRLKVLALALASAIISGCASNPLPAIPRAESVDLPKFMGSWYVIACIPTLIERDIYNAVETYQLDVDGSINTKFTFNKGSDTGEVKQYNPRGYVVENTNNAEWKMQFIWPIKSEFIIAHLDPDYSSTIIARNARDYVWIMARTPKVSEAKFESLKKMVGDMGYDLSKLKLIPQTQKEND